MAATLRLLPLAVAALLLALPAAARGSTRVNEAVSRLALGVFGSYVTRPSARQSRRRNVVLSAHMDVMYRVYAARTLLFATTTAVAGSILGLYAIVAGIQVLAVPAETMRAALPDRLDFLAETLTLPSLSVAQVFVLFLISSATFGAAAGVVMYLYRWSRPTRIADRRETRIEESLPRTVAFMFALSRSGMSHKALVETLARNSVYFGAAAEEFTISLRDMRFSNTDFLSATQRLARTTPSTEFANFAENLTDVLRTGRPMSEYFREQYEQYQTDKQSRQEQILEQLAALSEGYVALLVAGPLFLITILVIIGLLGGGTLGVLRAFVYLALPAASVGFVLYLGDLAAGLGIDAEIDEFDVDMARIRGDTETDAGEDAGSSRRAASVSPDGGAVVDDRAVLGRLATYDRLRTVREQLARPIRTALRSPDTVLYVAAPIGVLYALAGGTILYLEGALTIRAGDDYLIQACLFTLGTFAVSEYSAERRLRRIERALPDLIDRLADRTEAGMSFTRAIRELDPSSVPGLEPEIRELRADLAWGGRTSEALTRFAERTESVFAVRAVILIVNAAHASGDVAPVLRIAADEAQTDRRLDRRRRQELLVYLIIIYVSFLVFIGIIAALVVVFVPALPATEQLAGQASGAVPGATGLGSVGLGGSTTEDRAAYSLVVFHASIVQGAVAGFTAGKLSQGSVRAGAKHAAVMIGIAYVAMLVLA